MKFSVTDIFWILVAILFLAAMIRLAVRAVRSRTAPVTKVKATVADKHKIEHFSKYSGNGKSEQYVVVFLVGGKKKSFYVSEFSWRGYRVGDTGTLQYQGDKLIGFH